MTTPVERTMAVFRVQAFLKNLMLGNYPRVSKEVRAEARRLLKHFPMACDLMNYDAWDEPTVQKWAAEMDRRWRCDETSVEAAETRRNVTEETP